MDWNGLRRQRILFAVGTLAVLGLLWQPHVFLNDELVQGLGLDALAHGRLELHRPFPSDFEVVLEQGWHHAGIPKTNDTLPPLGSTPLNLLALPVYATLHVLSLVIGPSATLTFVTAGLAAAGLQLLWGKFSSQRARPFRWPAAALLFILVLVSVLTPVQRDSPADEFALELGSIQLVSMAMAAIGGLMVHDLLRERLPTQAWTVACAYTFATPVAFWGAQAKYHAMAITLVVAVAWSLGRLSEPRRFIVGGLAAGLACWNQLPLGVVAVAALGVAATLSAGPLARRSARAFLAALGAVPGLLGLAAEWAALRAHDQGSQYLSAAHPGGSLASSARSAFAGDAAATWTVFREAVVWTDGGQVGILAFACLAPFLVLGLAAAVPRLWRTPRDVVVFAAAYMVLLFVILRTYLADIGFGYENRHVTTLLPLLVILGAPALAEAAEAAGPRAWAWVAFGAAYVLGMNLLVNFLGHQLAYSFTHHNRIFDAVWLWRTLGAVAALAATGWATRMWWGTVPAWWREFGGGLWIVGLALSLSLQFWRLLGRDGFFDPPDEPFRFWLVEGLHQVFDRITYAVGSHAA